MCIHTLSEMLYLHTKLSLKMELDIKSTAECAKTHSFMVLREVKQVEGEQIGSLQLQYQLCHIKYGSIESMAVNTASFTTPKKKHGPIPIKLFLYTSAIPYNKTCLALVCWDL